MRTLEDLMQRITQELPYRVYAKDSNRRFKYGNAATLVALNCKGAAEIMRTRDEDYFAGSHLREAIQDEERLLRRNGPFSIAPKIEVETWRDGRLTRVVTEKRAWIGKNGERKGIIGFSHEI